VALCVQWAGGVVFAGKLLPRLGFPLEFDYLHATATAAAPRGGEIEWCGAAAQGLDRVAVCC